YEKGKYKKLLVHSARKRPYVSPAICNSQLWGEDNLAAQHDELVLCEGITDAIASEAAGFATISPVTTRLKRGDIPRVASKLRETVGVVYLVEDNEITGIGADAALHNALRLAR